MLMNHGSSGGKTRHFSRTRKSVIATVTGLALALGSVPVAQVAEAQVNVQPDYPDDSRAWDPTIAFGAGQPIADNPVLPSDQCGGEEGNLKIALVFDLSTSIGTKGLEESKTAGKAVVEALNDAPVQIGIYNFGSRAPSDFASEAQTKDGPAPQGSQEALTAIIDKLSIPSTGVEGTNWDRGIGQIPLKTYDVVYFITDGLPTTFDLAKGGERGLYNRPAYNHNYNGKANKDYAAAKNDVQRAVTSANELKNSGTRIVPLAVGDDVNDNEIAKTYLEYISGEGDWVPVTNFDTLATELVKQATEGCSGEVVIQKQLTDATGKPTNDSLAGFAFQASGISEKFHFTNTTATTDEDGKATFGYVAPDNAATGAFTIKEIGAEFKDVACTGDEPWQRKGNGFTVPAKAGGKVECTVTNPAPVTITETTTLTTTATPTVTKTETLDPSTTTQIVTTTVTEPPTVNKTVTETVTKTPEPSTVTEIPAPTTTTVTQTPATVTETVTTQVTETVEPPLTTVTATSTQTVTATETKVVSSKEMVTVTAEPVTVTETVTPAPVTETKTVVSEVAGEPVTLTATVTETVNNVIENVVTTTVQGEPATVTETETATTTVFRDREPVTTTATATVTETKTETVTTTVREPGEKETVVVTTTARLIPGSSNGGDGGSSASDITVDERCLPAALGLGIPVLALIPISLAQQISIPGLDGLVADINGRIDDFNGLIAGANARLQEQLGIFNPDIAQPINEFNARIARFQAENQQLLQWGGVLVATLGVASYLAYFCVPRTTVEPTPTA